MSFLGIMHIGSNEGGFDQWSFAHAGHHNDLTTSLNRTLTPTGDTTNTSTTIKNMSSVSGIFPGMSITGTGIPANTTVTRVDPVALSLLVSNAATATNTGVTLTITLQPIPYFILDPISLSDPKQFLLDHQLSHNAINAALGTQGNDLQDLDFNNHAEVRAWVELDFTEHQTWMLVTGVT